MSRLEDVGCSQETRSKWWTPLTWVMKLLVPLSDLMLHDGTVQMTDPSMARMGVYVDPPTMYDPMVLWFLYWCLESAIAWVNVSGQTGHW